MLLDVIYLYCGFLLEFSIVRHFGSERPSLIGLHGFGGIQPSPYSVGVQLVCMRQIGALILVANSYQFGEYPSILVWVRFSV